jgi:Xaa-Pro aminopeptidase
MDHHRRQADLRKLLDPHRLDALLVTHSPNIRYLCGFTGSAAALLLSESECVFFSDGRYTAQARSEVQGARLVIGKTGALASSAAWLKSHRVKKLRRIGIEAESTSVAARQRLAEALRPGWLIRSAPPLVEGMRLVKDAAEVESIRKAVMLGARLFERALEVIAPGVREKEVAAEMEYAARKGGADEMAFSTIVASGQRSALPHGRASDAPVSRNGFVVCDFGVILAGYCSDQTRTVFVGRPSPEARRAYQAVRTAQQAAIDAVKPGCSVADVDRAARKVLQREKLGRFFTHSTGHGLGLEIHEAPRLAAGQNQALRSGMVITIEPGVYEPGKWGVRIEDVVVVTEHGCEVLTPTSKELIAV